MATPKASGFKLSFSNAKTKPGFKAPAEKPAKRPRLDLGDDEPEDDNKKQEISGWDVAEGGAVSANSKKEEPKGPRIIPALPNRNWREEAIKKRLAKADVPPGHDVDKIAEGEEKKMVYGLTTFKNDSHEDTASLEAVDTTDDGGKEPDDGLTEEQRLEKRALDALLHGEATDHNVIPLQTEEEAFQHDIREAPDAPTLEAYEATPVEGFGAALLRGMGWKDGEGIGRDKGTQAKPKEFKRRPALLGIGAKDEAAAGIELGEWGKGNKKKVNVNYNPVTLRNKITGEMISEEELKARLDAQKMVDEKPSRSSRQDEDEDDERRREKRKERKERDRREDDYDSERRRDRDRRDDRRRGRDREGDYSDRDRQKEKEKKRYRDDDYSDSDRRREKRRDREQRDRSRSPDDADRRDKRRDRDRRYRSRSPDSDDRREKRRDRDRRDRDRSRSRDSDDRRKRRRDYDYEDVRDERKRRHKEDKYYRK